MYGFLSLLFWFLILLVPFSILLRDKTAESFSLDMFRNLNIKLGAIYCSCNTSKLTLFEEVSCKCIYSEIAFRFMLKLYIFCCCCFLHQI